MPCVVGTAGHIDHGKTSLVRALTGTDTDTLAEEKRRGLTIQPGFTSLTVELRGLAVPIAIVDVPGHERFIKNMLAGVTGIDLVLFCVAADDGIMPQTREHLDILHLLGVERGIIVITKCDLVDDCAVKDVSASVKELAKDTALENALIFRVSSETGEGIEELKAMIIKLAADTTKSKCESLFRMPIDRAFTVKGFGTVVTGTVCSGKLVAADEPLLFRTEPSVSAHLSVPLRVRSIERHHERVANVSVGERAAVNLGSLKRVEVARGDMLVSPEFGALRGKGVSSSTSPSPESFAEGMGIRRAEAVFEFLPSMERSIKNHASLKLFHLTSSSVVSIQIQGADIIKAESLLRGRLKLKTPLMMLRNDRFILRNPATNKTIGGGRVLMPYLSERLIKKISDVDYTPLLGDDAFRGFASLFDNSHSIVFIPLSEAALMMNVRAEMLGAALKHTELRELKGYVTSESMLAAVKKLLLKNLEKLHAKNPELKGFNQGAVAEGLRLGRSKGVEEAIIISEIIEELQRDGLLQRSGALFALSSHTPLGANPKDKPIEDAILSLLGRGFNATKLEDVMRLDFTEVDLKRLLKSLEERSLIVRIKHATYLSGAAIAVAREKLTQYLAINDTIKASEFRDELGTGRKLAIEILEYFDREKVTFRKGDERTLR
jgi:selenocysteine-specific elongation factor